MKIDKKRRFMTLFSSKTEVFLFKRTLIVVLLLITADLIFYKANISVIKGLLLGELLSLFKLRLMGKWLHNLLDVQGKKSKPVFVFTYVISQAAVILLLALILKKDIIMFAGFVCGLLSVPIVITINAITEGLQITHNHFE